MSKERCIEMQQQMQENQTELKHFLCDMDNWERDIKQKDDMLKKCQTPDQDKKGLPPVRNSFQKTKKKKKTKLGEEKKTQPIRSHDYKSWDKFNVDKACNEIDQESSESEYETDEEWEEQRKKQQAIALKDQGNEFLRTGKYVEAVECYTRGIDLDASNVLLPANRAMALIKQEQYAAAELDCFQAIHIDPTYIKAYLRRGTAREALKKYGEAKEDFLHALKVEPNNLQAKRELENIEKLLTPSEGIPNVEEEPGVVKAIYKPPRERSKRPLRRIKIQEICGEMLRFTSSSSVSQSTAKQDVLAKDKAMFKHFMESNIREQDKSTKTYFKEITDENYSCDQKEETGLTAVNTSLSQEKLLDVAPDSEDINGPTTSEKQTCLSYDSGQNILIASEVIPDVPRTSFQFLTDMKQLRNSPGMFFEYMKQIEPSSYTRLIGEALDSDVLKTILTTLKNYYVPENLDVIPVMKNLTKVKRFSMTVLFMSQSDKHVVKDLLHYMMTCGDSSEVNILVPKFLII